MGLYAARGIGEETVRMTRGRLVLWCSWLKQRRPQVTLERVDADLLVMSDRIPDHSLQVL